MEIQFSAMNHSTKSVHFAKVIRSDKWCECTFIDCPNRRLFIRIKVEDCLCSNAFGVEFDECQQDISFAMFEKKSGQQFQSMRKYLIKDGLM